MIYYSRLYHEVTLDPLTLKQYQQKRWRPTVNNVWISAFRSTLNKKLCSTEPQVTYLGVLPIRTQHWSVNDTRPPINTSSFPAFESVAIESPRRKLGQWPNCRWRSSPQLRKKGEVTNEYLNDAKINKRIADRFLLMLLTACHLGHPHINDFGDRVLW